MLDPAGGIRVERPDPLLRQAVQIGAFSLPGAERRNPHEIHPESDAVERRAVEPELLLDLSPRPRSVGEERAHTSRDVLDLPRTALGHLEPPRAAFLSKPGRGP